MQSKQSATGVLETGSARPWPVDERAQPLNLPTNNRRQSQALRTDAAAVAKFVLHFLEMMVAMGTGMAIFGPVKVALVDQGYATLLDRTSLDYQVWMNLFMIVPMVLWMRVRGCTWRHGAEMGGAMIILTVCVLLLCGLGVSNVLPWFTASLSGMAMFLGMLGIMLYRRDRYTGGYSLAWLRWRRARS